MCYIGESREVSKRISFNNVEVVNETNFKVKSEGEIKLYDVSNVNDVWSIVAKCCALTVSFVHMNILAHTLTFTSKEHM